MSDETEEADELPEATDPTLRRMLGSFDTPAFARRGSDLERSLNAFHQRCAAVRREMLPMVELRLRQWLAVATGPLDFAGYFQHPLDALFAAADLPMTPWAAHRASNRARQRVAIDLETSTLRFNRRWRAHVEKLDLAPLNRMIDAYNNYYILEKECVVGAHRLAARFFQPCARLSTESILSRWPTLPMPSRVGASV